MPLMSFVVWVYVLHISVIGLEIATTSIDASHTPINLLSTKKLFPKHEWIVVDDCSTDDSFSYIKNLTNDDSRTTALRTNKNGGTAVARNAGLRHAKGRYITFLDSDDLLDPNYLEK